MTVVIKEVTHLIGKTLVTHNLPEALLAQYRLEIPDQIVCRIVVSGIQPMSKQCLILLPGKLGSLRKRQGVSIVQWPELLEEGNPFLAYQACQPQSNGLIHL
ncbi:hypothetical protein [Achromobacter deleyi]|uniref:hypothetical protein n=1 Tax=Achromobacter deleyi TaxID=1353891 RepID=UPI001491A9C0|nr:hypothetical protein [Achromobacter deleyi]QVQ27375.1 hypothetical protein HLG70_02665 [Achromobacter deleyi]UIP22970.1 hypothetical protein LYZ39_10770 [Achromobacter deleyi]